MIELNPMQKGFVKWAYGRQSVLLVSSAGSGKTGAVLSLLKMLREYQGFKTTLVITKAKAMVAFEKSNWYGETVKKIALDKDLYKIKGEGDEGIYTITPTLLTKLRYDTKLKTKREKFKKLLGQIDLFVIDEVHDFRNYKNKSSKAVKAVTDYFHQKIEEGKSPRLVTMTATPIYRALENYHAIFSLINPNIFGSWFSFRNRYCVLEDRSFTAGKKVFHSNGSSKVDSKIMIQNIVDYKNVDELNELIKPYVYSNSGSEFTFDFRLKFYDFTKDEATSYRKILKGYELDTCFDIVVNNEMGNKKIEVLKNETLVNPNNRHMSPEKLRVGSKIIYDGMLSSVTGIESRGVTGTHSVRMLKAQGELSGAVKKLELLKGLLDDEAKGCLIYFNYKNSLQTVYEYLRKTKPDRKLIILTGDTKNIETKMSYINDSDIVLITRVAKQSLDFYFDHLILYEHLTSSGAVEQLFGRLTRHNSKYREIKVDLVMRKKSVEEYCYEKLRLHLRSNRYRFHTKDLPRGVTMKNIPEENLDLTFLKRALLWAM